MRKTISILLLTLFTLQANYAFTWKTLPKLPKKTLGTPEGDAKKGLLQTKKDLKALEEDAADPFFRKTKISKKME